LDEAGDDDDEVDVVARYCSRIVHCGNCRKMRRNAAAALLVRYCNVQVGRGGGHGKTDDDDKVEEDNGDEDFGKKVVGCFLFRIQIWVFVDDKIQVLEEAGIPQKKKDYSALLFFLAVAF
jgi:hypothetical protein